MAKYKYMEVDCAWLSGFWDGEGSVGLVKNKAAMILVAQLSHTECSTIEHILLILKKCQVNGRGYTYQGRDPLKHRDAHYIRVSGMANILRLAELLCPYAVTKKRHWGIAIEWAKRRIKVAGGIDSKGHLHRGGRRDRSYSESEMMLASEMMELNRRGPVDRARRAEGRIVV